MAPGVGGALQGSARANFQLPSGAHAGEALGQRWRAHGPSATLCLCGHASLLGAAWRQSVLGGVCRMWCGRACMRLCVGCVGCADVEPWHPHFSLVCARCSLGVRWCLREQPGVLTSCSSRCLFMLACPWLASTGMVVCQLFNGARESLCVCVWGVVRPSCLFKHRGWAASHPQQEWGTGAYAQDASGASCASVRCCGPSRGELERGSHPHSPECAGGSAHPGASGTVASARRRAREYGV